MLNLLKTQAAIAGLQSDCFLPNHSAGSLSSANSFTPWKGMLLLVNARLTEDARISLVSGITVTLKLVGRRLIFWTLRIFCENLALENKVVRQAAPPRRHANR
jgi:hypothetical protein